MKTKKISLFALALILACFMSGCGFETIKMNPGVPVYSSPDQEYPIAIVVYDSWSGNTARIADIIAEKLMAPVISVNQVNEYDLNDFDLIVVGSPVHGGSPTKKIKTFLSELPAPPMSAVFVTFGAPLFGPLTADACLDKMEKILQGTSLGRFKCHGFHKILRTYPSHPDEKDAVDAAQFAAEILERCLNNDNPI